MFLSVYNEDPNVTLLFQKNFWEVMGFNEKGQKMAVSRGSFVLDGNCKLFSHKS